MAQLPRIRNAIPSNWDKYEIGKICTVIGGGTPSRAVSSYFGGNIVWLTPTQIDKTKIKTVCSSNEHITKHGLDNSAAKIIPKGAILLTTRASIGYVAIAGCKLTTNQGFKSLVCKPRVYNYYLAYWLSANRGLLNIISTGTTFKEVSTRAIRKLIVPLPPIGQQRIIAEKIESIFAEIDSVMRHADDNVRRPETFIHSLDNLKLSVLDKTFRTLHQMYQNFLNGAAIHASWHKKTLDKLVTLESGSRPKGGVSRYTEGIPSIGAEHLNYDGGLVYDKLKYVPEHFYASMNYGHIKHNDILLVKDGATIGKVSLAAHNFPFKRACVNEHVFILRPKNTNIITQNYLFYYLRTSYAQNIIKSRVSGTAQGGLTKKFICGFDMLVPPQEEQRRVVTKIESIFAKIDSKIYNLIDNYYIFAT